MAFAIKRRPPLNGSDFYPFFYPTFLLLQLNLNTNMKRILHLVQNLQLLVYSAIFMVTSTAICI